MTTMKFAEVTYRDTLTHAEKVILYKEIRGYLKKQLIYVSERMSVVEYVLNRDEYWRANKRM